MKILMLHRQPSSVSYYRTFLPAKALRKAGHDVTTYDTPYRKSLQPTPNEWAKDTINKYDVIIIDRAIVREDISLFAGVRHYSELMGTRIICDFDDDFTNVPWWNTSKGRYEPGQESREAGLMQLRLSEMTTVTSKSLSKTFKKKTHNISVAPNAIDPEDWIDLPTNPDRDKDEALYILYGGASGHFGDLDEARLGIEPVIKNPPVPIRLVCFGALPAWLHTLAQEYPERVITLPWIPFKDYPQTIAWGKFSLAIAPLADHIFNEAKSNIKWLEAGIQKIPFLCSDIGPYKEIPKGCAIKVDNTPVQWAEALRNLLTDSALRGRIAKKAYKEIMKNHTVDKIAPVWDSIVNKTRSLPRIESLEDTRFKHETTLIPEELPKVTQKAPLIVPTNVDVEAVLSKGN